MMSTTHLPALIQSFFIQGLLEQQDVSPCTLLATETPFGSYWGL